MSKGLRRDYHGKLGGRCVERTKNSAERGSGRRERKDESVLNQAEVGEEQNNPNRIDDATIFELEDVRGVGGDLKTAGDNRTVSRKAGEEK